MAQYRAIALLLIGVALGAQAQTAASGVQESTDPAKATAVERAAAELKARAARDATIGRKSAAVGLVRGRTERGQTYLSGGITVEDRVATHAERADYSLWVATVAKPSGAYLVDAQLRIVDLKSKATVLERTMEGPWFFVALPAGRYEILATYRDDGASEVQTLATRVEIPQSGQRQAVLRFASSADVSPDMQSPFKGNPFASPPLKN